MRKVVYGILASLDGFIEDHTGSFDWSVPSDELHQHFNDQEARYDLHLYGRRLYENMAAFWPTADQDPDAPPIIIEYARIWKAMPKLVFSRTLKAVGDNATLAEGELAETVRSLKTQPGKDINVGGAEIAASLSQHGLIDEYALYVHPVLLGGGKPAFGALPNPRQLKLGETQTFQGGVVLLRYHLA